MKHKLFHWSIDCNLIILLLWELYFEFLFLIKLNTLIILLKWIIKITEKKGLTEKEKK